MSALREIRPLVEAHPDQPFHRFRYSNVSKSCKVSMSMGLTR